MASNIVEDAVEAATTTLTNINDHQSQRRFSVYKNAGEHGKSLLFQSNTFVPSIENPKEKFDETSPGIFDEKLIRQLLFFSPL